MNPVSTAPTNKTVWALVATEFEVTSFWTIAEYNGSEWVGLSPWDEHPSYTTFEDLNWTVKGWTELVAPPAP